VSFFSWFDDHPYDDCVFFSAVCGRIARSETITVEEAIKHNEGHAAVEGYVVGHTVSSGHYRFSGNFANDYNIAIADKKRGNIT
jgi:hypothetical protein